MTFPHRDTLLLLLAVAWTMFAAITVRPPELPSDDRAFRHLFATEYLALKRQTLSGNTNLLFLQVDHVRELSPAKVEALAVLCGLEGRLDDLRKCLTREDLPNGQTIAYAFGLRPEAPSDWLAHLRDDYFDHQIKVLVYERQGESERRVEAMFELRVSEAAASRDFTANTVLSYLSLFGLGLLVSMSITSRQFRRMGQNFFNLTPLFLPRWYIFRVVTSLLVVAILLELGQPALTAMGLAPWQWSVIRVLCLSAMLIGNLRAKLRPDLRLFTLMGLDNLTMQPSHIFRIIGGVAIIAGCTQFFQTLAALAQWPTMPGLERFAPIVESPIGIGLYLLVGCILSAAFHEIAFRGLAFRGFLASMRPGQAIVLSAFLYAMMFPMPYWPTAFAKGCGLALIYYRTDSLVVPIWSNALWNCLILLMAVLGVTL